MPIDFAFLRYTFWCGLTHGLEPAHGIAAVALFFLALRTTPWHALAFGLSAFLGQFFGMLALGLIAWGTSTERGFNDALVLNTELTARLTGATIVIALGLLLWRRRRTTNDPAAKPGWTPLLASVALGQAVGLLQCRVMLTPLVFSFGQRQVAVGILGVALFALGLALVQLFTALIGWLAQRQLAAGRGAWTQRVPSVMRTFLILAGGILALQAIAAR